MENENTLPLVNEKEEIRKNIATLDGYLSGTNSGECEYAKRLIKKGKSFVIVASQNGYSFYPSRFMGYINNSMEAHETMGEIRRHTGKTTRDGKKTNPAISSLLGNLIKQEDEQWAYWETEYKTFCNRLGLRPDNNKRSYWSPNIR